MTLTLPKSANRAPSMEPNGQFIEGPLGIQLYGLSFGDPGATHKLLFIHGGLQAWPCFREQYEALADQDCFIVTFDLPWHGLSGPDPEQADIVPTAELWAESLEAVLHHFGLLGEQVTIVGWSMAGLPIRNYLQFHGPAGIAGIVLVGTTLDFNTFVPVVQQEIPETMELMARLMDTQSPMSAQHAAFLGFVDKLWWQRPSSEQYYLTLGYNTRGFISAGPLLAGMLATQAPGETQDLLGRLRCPVLVVQGLRDELAPPALSRQFARMLTPGQVSVLELPDCGHSPFLEQPEVFNTAVLAFLEGPVREFVAGVQ